MQARHVLPLLALTLGLVPSVRAQTVTTFPSRLPASLSGNTIPFNMAGTGGHRTQFIYDGSLVPSTGPILIQRLRFRRSSAPAGVGNLKNVTCSLSTSPVKWNALTTSFANHVGKDAKVIFKGNLVLNGTAWFVDIRPSSPFLYDKSKGSLCFDFVRQPGTGSTGQMGGYFIGTASAPFKANRLFGSPTSPTGSLDAGSISAKGYACVAEIVWGPAKGLYSSFSASPLSGKSPLKVQFQDTTFTSSPPVTNWKWDFNGDKVVDSTLPNPTYTFKASGWDKTFDVTLETTDGMHPASKVTMKAFITVNPSTATAVDFGKGSTNRPILAPIALPRYERSYSSTSTRGFHFVAPTPFMVTGFEAPNDYPTKEPEQTITCYVLPKPPTGSFTATAADIRFRATGPSNTILKPVTGILVKPGEWFGVLGACHGRGTTASFRNSYGNSGKSTVLGAGITLGRLTHGNARTTKGLGWVGVSSGGSIGRVFVHVAGNNGVPTLTSIGLPRLAATPKLDFRPGFRGVQGGIIFLGSDRFPAPIRTQVGNLLVKPPYPVTVFIPNGTGQLPVPIPNDPTLTGVVLDFQGMTFDVTNGLFGTSNGTEWFVGK